MKLAFVTPRFLPEGVVGGAETLIRDLASICAGAGHEVHLLSTCAVDHQRWENVSPAGEREFEGMRVHLFPVNPDRDHRAFARVEARIGQGRPLDAADLKIWETQGPGSRELIAWLEREAADLDLIFAGPYLFSLILHAARVAPQKTWLIPCLHDEPFARLSPLRTLFQEVRGCLFNSDPERDLAVGLFDLPPHRDRVLGMAIDPFDADPDAFARRHGIKLPYVLYSGRQEIGKNTHLLFDYVYGYVERRPARIQLVLTGSGGCQPPRELRPHLLNAGFLSEQEKHEAMAGAAVFLHPSLNESFGIVLLESWMAGTPALVHARSQVLRWQCARADAGFWFENYPEFESMLDRLLDDPALNRRLGENGRRYVRETYSRERICSQLLEILNS